MEINPRINGIHSMAMALKAFKEFHNDPNNIFALKDSILRSHHGLETLFKHVLFLSNPVLLVKEDVKIKKFLEGYERYTKGEIVTPIYDLWTAGLVRIVKRLWRFGLLESLTPEEYNLFLESVEKLRSHRDKLQHLGLSANPDEVGRILGNVIPRAIEVLGAVHSYIPNIGYKRIFPKIITDLNGIFSDSQKIIKLLRNEYDQLIKKAVDFLRDRKFAGESLRLKIEDHGEVGSPPYSPKLHSEGFINWSWSDGHLPSMDVHLTDLTTPTRMHAIESIQAYWGKIELTDTKFVNVDKTTRTGEAHGLIGFNGNISLERAGESLALTEASEHISMLRGINIKLAAELEYDCDAIITDYHYISRKVKKSKGKLNVTISAVPKGYESEEIELVGHYESELNEENAPFRITSFLNPDGSLKSNYSLEWTLNTKGDVSFR